MLRLIDEENHNNIFDLAHDLTGCLDNQIKIKLKTTYLS